MRPGKIVLWTFAALLISGIIFVIVASNSTLLGGSGKMVFGIGQLYTVEDIKDSDLEGITRIEVSFSSPETTFFTTNNSNVKAALTGSVRTTNTDAVPYLVMTRSGDTLMIKEERRSNVVMGFFNSDIKLDISLPESFHGDLTVNGSSGRLNISRLVLQTLEANLSSGTMNLGNIEAQSLMVKTSSGSFRLDKFAGGSAYFQTSSGSKKLGTLELTGDLTIHSSSGSVNVTSLSCKNATVEGSSGTFNADAVNCNSIAVKNSSGSITIKRVQGAASLKTNSGSINASFTEPKDHIEAECSSGSISLQLPENTGFTVDASTSSGNISNDFGLEKDNGRRLTGKTGDGAVAINVRTSSGSIKIKK